MDKELDQLKEHIFNLKNLLDRPEQDAAWWALVLHHLDEANVLRLTFRLEGK